MVARQAGAPHEDTYTPVDLPSAPVDRPPRYPDPVVPSCRSGCGACCIAPSIARPFPGMPQGKPAGVPCVHLDAALRCGLFGHPDRPEVCSSLQPSAEMCGSDRHEALAGLGRLEALTAPGPSVR